MSRDDVKTMVVRGMERLLRNGAASHADREVARAVKVLAQRGGSFLDDVAEIVDPDAAAAAHARQSEPLTMETLRKRSAAFLEDCQDFADGHGGKLSGYLIDVFAVWVSDFAGLVIAAEQSGAGGMT